MSGVYNFVFNRGHYITNAANALLSGEIPQHYHTFVLFDSPQMGSHLIYRTGRCEGESGAKIFSKHWYLQCKGSKTIILDQHIFNYNTKRMGHFCCNTKNMHCHKGIPLLFDSPSHGSHLITHRPPTLLPPAPPEKGSSSCRTSLAQFTTWKLEVFW